MSTEGRATETGWDPANPLLYFKANDLGSTKFVPAGQTGGGTAAGGAPSPFVPIVGAAGEEVKLVDIAFPDGIAREIIANFINLAAQLDNGQFFNMGPLIGICEWGVGGGRQRIEFNLPQANTFGVNGNATGNATRQLQGRAGTSLTITASSLALMVRNDQNTAPINGGAGATVGPFLSAFVNPRVSGFVGIGSGDKQCGPLQRIYTVVSGQAGSTPFAPPTVVNVAVPSFARRLRVQRNPLATSTVDVLIGSINGSHGLYTLGSGNVGPIELAATDQIVTIQNSGAVDITRCQVVFDLEM